MIGKTLAHYEITSHVGKGGMGEVYQATDKKLGRDVAIKVLPEEFAQDTDRVARFQREAKLLASLNHPNIASIYGLEESGGTNFLVMELVEGNTLDDRIKSGAIPEVALKLALQIAEALEAAHEKGVIHRDLKPANIKITPDGKIKVLDFGLAKAFAGEQSDMNLSNSPTLSVAATQQGVILGTAAYMSPEQARGKEVDKRADIWAFGVVLFEMLTGKQVFTGDTVSDTLASVLAREPEWQSLPQNLHPRIQLLLERCLKKETTNRYSGISDARVDIQEVLADPNGVLVKPVTMEVTQKKLRIILPWIAVSLIAGLILSGVAVWLLKPSPPPEPKQVHRYDYTLPEDQEFVDYDRQNVAVSADGSKIAYIANDQLYIKNSDDLTARLIRGIDGDLVNPFFSPNGEWIGYFDLSNDQLKKVAVGGGSPVMICEVKDPEGATWGADDMIVLGEPEGIMQVSANAGIPKIIINKEESDRRLMHPQILPDGKTVLFTAVKQNLLQIAVQSLESGERKNLFAGGPAQYVSTGHLVYGLDNILYAVRFNPETLEVTGGGIAIEEGIFRFAPIAPIQSDISESGTLAYLPGNMLLGASIGNTTLVWIDREGNETSLAAEPNDYRYISISPDGTKVALTIAEGDNEDIHIWDIARQSMNQLTFDDTDSSYPVWTADSKSILFVSDRNDSRSIYRKNADGAGGVDLISEKDGIPFSLSADGKSVLLMYIGTSGSNDIGILSVEGDQDIKPLLQQEYSEGGPLLSSNGKWMAYQSNRSGFSEVYVRPFPNVDDGPWKISAEGGFFPRWSPDGRELYYINEFSLWVAAVNTEKAFQRSQPKMLFQIPHVVFNSMGLAGITWDVHPDGDRFLMLKPPANIDSESASLFPDKINIVLNWFEELKQKVPVP